ncbi:MAG: replication-relaxation family protein [Dehalococcoidia bacterium]
MTKRAVRPSEEPFHVLPSYERVLQALGRYERLTAEQVRRLFLGEHSLTRAQHWLKVLHTHGYVTRTRVGREAEHGSGPLVSTLDRRGIDFLRSIGRADSRRLRQSEEEERASAFLLHSSKVVDVLILCDLLCRDDGRFAIERMIGERELRSTAVTVTMPDGRSRGVAMDGWVDLRIYHTDGTIEQMCLGFEVDNGTEWQAAWRLKVQALLAMESGPYVEAFGVETLTIVVVAPTAERALQFRLWTEAELAAQGAEDRGDLFRFGVMPPDLSDASAFFRALCWQRAGETASVPLIEE